MVLSKREQEKILAENQAYRNGTGAKPGFRARINLQCKDCLYDDRAAGLGAWRQQVEACEDDRCPLWPLRPTSTAETTEGSTENDPIIPLERTLTGLDDSEATDPEGSLS